jgi:1,2-phenylacetyl-CoA epoxidase catalytic subunit
MEPRAFVDEMETTLWQILAVRDTALSRLGQTVGKAEQAQLLKGALRNEMEAAEIAAAWMPGTPEIEAKIAFARQTGDEARHYQLIAARLRELGTDLAGFSPLGDGRTRLYRYLETLPTTVERVAAAQFTREAIGYKANELFIAYCEACGDDATATLYREEIQPDEMRHHKWGAELLRTLARTEEEQAGARRAILTTLELAEELRSLAAGRLLVEALPGC